MCFNVDPKNWLALLLADGVARGVTIREMVDWLFPADNRSRDLLCSPEIQRFDSMRREFTLRRAHEPRGIRKLFTKMEPRLLQTIVGNIRRRNPGITAQEIADLISWALFVAVRSSNRRL